MDKILVEVYLPAMEKAFDVLIPGDQPIIKVRKLISDALTFLSEGMFAGDEKTVLCDRETGQIFDVDMTAAEAGIKNQSRLMLI